MRKLFRLLAPLAILALAVAPAAAQPVGVAAAVNQSATGLPPSSSIRTIALGDNIVHDERIDTNSVGLVQLLLADGTTFTVGPNSSLVIDSFVYDPAAGTAQVAATLTKGVLRFIGAATSKTPDGVAITTPVGVVGIRGGVTDINMSPPNGIPPHVSMIFGNEVTLSNGGDLVGRLFEAGYSLAASGGGIETMKTPPEWSSQIQAALSGAPGQTGGAPRGPTNATVVQSKVADVNSGQTPADAPIPMPPLVRAGELADELVAGAPDDLIADDHGDTPDGPVVVETRFGLSSGIMGVTASAQGQVESGSFPLLTFIEGASTRLTEIGFDADGKPVTGVFEVQFAPCPQCTFTFDTTTGAMSVFGGVPGQPGAEFTADASITGSDDAVLPTGNYCACAFLDWGLWSVSTAVNYQGYGYSLDVNGQWVVGDITTGAQLDDLATRSTTTATYEGTAIGTVTPDLSVDGDTYLARGEMDMTWSFGQRDGTISISDFDGRDFGGQISSPNGVAGFVGGLSDGQQTLAGLVNGVFVNDGTTPAAGVMGNFGIDDGTWGATGIIIGESVP